MPSNRMVASFILLIVSCAFISSSHLSAAQRSASGKQWVGTWACAPYEATSANLPSQPLTNKTLRQIVRVSIGGDTVRVKFSNITCANAVTINAVTIAASPDGTKCPVDGATITQIKFSGSESVTIGPYSDIISDPVAFDLTPGMRLAISVYYGQCQTSSDMTFHYGSRTNSYLVDGDKTESADFSGTPMERWFTISGVDVLAPRNSGSVVCFGNSITDGYGLNGGLQNRWTDAFSEALLANDDTKQVGVLNLGIGATLVTGASNGAKSGLDRFEHDVLGQSGVRWIIIIYGINDINGGVDADALKNAFKTMATQAHAHDENIKVYCGTLTPHPPANGTINTLNEWIRNNDDMDGLIDFNEALRDPNDQTKILQMYNNDNLHPNAEGYKAMGQCIDLDMFKIPVAVNMGDYDAHRGYAVDRSNGNSLNMLRFWGSDVSMYSINGRRLSGAAAATAAMRTPGVYIAVQRNGTDASRSALVPVVRN